MQRLRLLLIFLAASLLAQDMPEFWPGATYDPGIPTFRKVLGYEPGERISSHADLLKYLEALASASPRIKLFDYAKSWEGRRLVYAVIASGRNMKRLEAICDGMQKLADPLRTPESDARELIGSLPAVIWLGYGVHGNELSSPEAAALTAYHLLAARKDKMIQEVLANVVVLIDPLQNPDGHDRFVHNFEQAEGLEPDRSPLAAEHNEPWPGGRTNHYLFDLNRDWFALTQPETRGRIKVLQEWYPLVFVDLHEMGSDATYYFAPEAIPYNPHLTRQQRESLNRFGENNARWFDHFGFRYFTREVFDAFYPGYGASWPSFYGAIAMTYEQASTRGLLIRRRDETILHFRDTVRHHFVASLSTAETAARNREDLLREFYHYQKTAIDEGNKESVREYILPRHGNVSAVDKLAALLVEQGVEVKRAVSSFRNAGKEYPKGSYVIPMAQPSKRLVRTLFDTNVPMEESFVKEQERRRKKKMPDEIYDVTAWSLPLLFNIEAVATSEASQGSFEMAQNLRVPAGEVNGGEASVAYLAPWGTAASARLLTAALREGLHVLSSDKSFMQNGRKFPSGTLIFQVSDNSAELRKRLEGLAASSGAEITATDTSWVEEGVNFGSNHVVSMRKPDIALAWDRPVSAYSAGWTRFVLERQFRYPVTPVRTRQLASADLGRFDVIVLPDGAGYSEVFGANGPRRLKEWIDGGGTLIGIGGAVSYLADPKVKLLAISQENEARPAEAKKFEKPAQPPEAAKRPEAPSETRVPGRLLATEEDYIKAIQPDSELPDNVQGVIVKARLDPDHWLAAGIDDTVNVVITGRAIFTPIKLDKGVNVAVFPGPGELLQSGYLWEENRKQLAFKPFVVVQKEGRGMIIGFTADPNFRAYMDGLHILFLNAVFRGPAHAGP